MKRTCLRKGTTCPDYSGNTDEQIACEFHPVAHFVKTGKPEPTENQ